MTPEFSFPITMLGTRESKIVFRFQFGLYGKLNKLKYFIYLEIHRCTHKTIMEIASGQKSLIKGNNKPEQEPYKILKAAALVGGWGQEQQTDANEDVLTSESCGLRRHTHAGVRKEALDPCKTGR